MVNPNEISEVAVLTHAIKVRSYARRVRSTASRVDASIIGSTTTPQSV